MLGNFLRNHRLWIWKTSHFASHNLWLQKCSYSTYLGNKWLFIFRDKMNTAIFLSVEHFLPSVSCLPNFLGGRKNENFQLRKPRQSCFVYFWNGLWIVFLQTQAQNHELLSLLPAGTKLLHPGKCQLEAASPSSVQHQAPARCCQVSWDECGTVGSNVTSDGLGHSAATSACKKQAGLSPASPGLHPRLG